MNGDKIKELEEKLAQSEKNVEEFEALAHEWKFAHRDLNLKYKRDIGNLQIRVDDLEAELQLLLATPKEKAPEE